MVVVAAGKWGHNMEVQEVHKLREHYRQVQNPSPCSTLDHYAAVA